MKKENRTDRQLLLDISNSISSECGKTISDLLSAMDNNGIQYKPSYFIHTDDVPEKIYYMSSLNFDLAITLDDGSKILIDLEMPEEALDQMEDIPGYGSVPSKAYEWLLKKYLPGFDDENAETLQLLAEMPEHLRKLNFEKRMRLVDNNTALSDEDRIAMYRLIENQAEFFMLSETERKRYFDSHRQTLDFDKMSKGERYDYLKAVDAILRPVIGNNGFPDWRNPDFINSVLKK